MTPKLIRAFAFLLTLAMLLPVLAGCGNKGQNVSPESIAQSGKDKRQKTGP